VSRVVREREPVERSCGRVLESVTVRRRLVVVSEVAAELGALELVEALARRARCRGLLRRGGGGCHGVCWC